MSLDEHGGDDELEVGAGDAALHVVECRLEGVAEVDLVDDELDLAAHRGVHLAGDELEGLHKAEARAQGVRDHGQHVAELIREFLASPADAQSQEGQAHQDAHEGTDEEHRALERHEKGDEANEPAPEQQDGLKLGATYRPVGLLHHELDALALRQPPEAIGDALNAVVEQGFRRELLLLALRLFAAGEVVEALRHDAVFARADG